jgi:molybdate transport system ATP-binding protein
MNSEEITTKPPEKRGIGIVYQDYALLPHMDVYDNIAYGLKKKSDRPDMDFMVKEMAKRFDIDPLLHRSPKTLSGGEQQRVALARALIVEPELLLMDEPFSALDPQTRRRARELMGAIVREKGTTVIHISHDLNDVWALATKVAFLRQGQLLQFGSLEEVFARPNGGFIADFVDATMFKGEIKGFRDGMTVIDIDGMEFLSLDEGRTGSRVRVAIRPEEVIVSRSHPGDTSAQNIIKTKLFEIVPEGRACMLALKMNTSFLPVFISNNSARRMELSEGDTLYAMLKAAHVRVVDMDIDKGRKDEIAADHGSQLK